MRVLRLQFEGLILNVNTMEYEKDDLWEAIYSDYRRRLSSPTYSNQKRGGMKFCKLL